MQLSTSKTENWKTKHRSGSEDVCRSYMYMPESKSVVQVVRRNSSLELPVGHDLFHLTFKSEQHAETHRIVRDKFKGEVRTINDRNICERRSCMKNNGKSPTFKFVSGEESRPSEVQRVSRDWRLPGATHSSADLTWIRK